MTASARSILHVDMDAFYASVEQRDNPELRDKPLAVGGTGNRGVVAAASYEAREFGVRSAMPMREALRRCPDLLRVRPRMSHYKAVSEQVFEIFRHFTPLVEGLSLDEAFLDVTASESLFGAPIDIARSIKKQILATTEVTASVGVAAVTPPRGGPAESYGAPLIDAADDALYRAKSAGRDRVASADPDDG